MGEPMNGWRIGYAIGLVVFVATPLFVPFAGVLEPGAWVWTSNDADRLSHLALNSFALTAGTTALSLPLGTCLAVLLFRTGFVGRRLFLFVLVLVLFIPLPVFVACWQGLLGGARPWATGIGPAIWIHTVVAVPWVSVIVGVGLTWVDPELEEEAAQIVGPWRVLTLVTLSRARASVLSAALFVVVQTLAEVGVTEMLQVPTLAEEVRAQFARGEDAALARTLVVSIPGLLLTWGAVLAALAYLEQRLPPPAPPFREPRPLAVGGARRRAIATAWIMALLTMPFASLIWRLGLSGHPSAWNSATAWHFLASETHLLGNDLIATLITSAAGGVLTAALAVVGCWLASDCRWFRWLLFSVLTWAWVMPGPVVGIGLHGLIAGLPDGPWKVLLYYGPSPAPLVWVQTMRALPIAVVFLWPMARTIPREWFEEARLGGAGPVNEFVHIVVPTTWRAVLVTCLAATALCLGEVSASPRVETPGWGSFTRMLLDRLHYGVDNSLAALSVLMLASVAALGVVFAVFWIWWRR